MSDVLIVVAVFAGAMALIFGGAVACDSHFCDRLHRDTGLQTKYASLQCYVKVGAQWVPEKNWRVEP